MELVVMMGEEAANVAPICIQAVGGAEAPALARRVRCWSKLGPSRLKAIPSSLSMLKYRVVCKEKRYSQLADIDRDGKLAPRKRTESKTV
eukprot:CAMPEP_0181497864 /NCGR_PEP_ID=MMETSP1110-20121109/53772_1 /TAXON_ID=174948 /ORGANISM="Symbiodinium sp., Strain CCMP421" /LENGTH=89 /DNA_ID=CAMNT_0023625851 /DNA_START=361 /DNA_END=630 /DNA_ORIENTATION=+